MHTNKSQSNSDLESAMRATARDVSTCLSSAIGQYRDYVASRLVGDDRTQCGLAFALRDMGKGSLVQFNNGFQTIRKQELYLYTDSDTYLNCTSHLDIPGKEEWCHNSLQGYFARVPTTDAVVKIRRNNILEVLRSNAICKCDQRNSKNNRYHCQRFSGTEHSCADDEVCDSVPFGIDHMRGVCRKRATCKHYVCSEDHYFDPVRTYYQCEKTSCTQTECCKPKATCDSFYCHGTLSNMGSGTLCDKSESTCTQYDCCYCSAWHLVVLPVGAIACGLSKITRLDALNSTTEVIVTDVSVGDTTITSKIPAALMAMVGVALGCMIITNAKHSLAQRTLQPVGETEFLE